MNSFAATSHAGADSVLCWWRLVSFMSEHHLNSINPNTVFTATAFLASTRGAGRWLQCVHTDGTTVSLTSPLHSAVCTVGLAKHIFLVGGVSKSNCCGIICQRCQPDLIKPLRTVLMVECNSAHLLKLCTFFIYSWVFSILCYFMLLPSPTVSQLIYYDFNLIN